MKKPIRTEKLWARVSRELMKQLELRTLSDKQSKSDIVNRALKNYLTDLTDESLLAAKITITQQKLEYLEKKFDLFTKYNQYWNQFLLSILPELPKNNEERNLLSKRARDRIKSFNEMFAAQLKNMPAFTESLLTDFITEENI